MDVLSIEQAGTCVDAAALGLLALGLAGVALKRLEVAIIFLALQGALLGVATGAAALAEGGWRGWAAFGIALAVKLVAIPLMLWFVLNRVAVRHEVESVVPLKLAVPLATGLVLFAYWVARPIASDPLGGQHGFDAPNALPAALSLLLLGLFTMATRRKALTQVIGLVTMENGIYLAAVAATGGLPIAVEFGIALDVLTGAALMALVTLEINRMFVTIDTDRLRSLRG